MDVTRAARNQAAYTHRDCQLIHAYGCSKSPTKVGSRSQNFDTIATLDLSSDIKCKYGESILYTGVCKRT